MRLWPCETFAKANASRSKPKIAAAGALIYGIFETRGLTLYRFGYNQQSAAMNLLIEDLSAPEAIQALATINAASWFDDLIVAQEEFEQIVSNKSEFEAQQDVSPVRTSRVQR